MPTKKCKCYTSEVKPPNVEIFKWKIKYKMSFEKLKSIFKIEVVASISEEWEGITSFDLLL